MISLSKADETKDLQKKVADLEDRLRIHNEYGTKLTGEAMETIKAEEEKQRLNEQRRIEGAKRARIEEEKQEKELRAFAVELVKQGKIRVAVNGVPISKIEDSLVVPCPICNGSLKRTSDAIHLLAETWKNSLKGHDLFNSQICNIHPSGGALSNLVAIVGFYDGGCECKTCHEKAKVFIQPVFV